MPCGLSSELIAQRRSTVLVGSIAGSKLWNTWVVGQMPGHPNGLFATRPAPLGLRLPEVLPLPLLVGYVPAGKTHSPNAFELCAKCWIDPARPETECDSDVPAPDSNARKFIGCFEYSYDSTAVEKPAR